MIKVATYDTIRELHFNKGLSKREIAKRLMVHRNTVTRALEREDNEYLLTVEKEKPVNGNFIDRIKVMLEENSNTRKKKDWPKLECMSFYKRKDKTVLTQHLHIKLEFLRKS